MSSRIMELRKEISRLFVLSMKSIETLPEKVKAKENNKISTILGSYMTSNNEKELRESLLLLKNKYDMIKEVYQLDNNEGIKEAEKERQREKWKDLEKEYKKIDEQSMIEERKVQERAKELYAMSDQILESKEYQQLLKEAKTKMENKVDAPPPKREPKENDLKVKIDESYSEMSPHYAKGFSTGMSINIDATGIPVVENIVQTFGLDKDGNLVQTTAKQRPRAKFTNWYGCNPDPECVEKHYQLLERQHFKGPFWEGKEVKFMWEDMGNVPLYKVSKEEQAIEEAQAKKNMKPHSFKKIIR